MIEVKRGKVMVARAERGKLMADANAGKMVAEDERGMLIAEAEAGKLMVAEAEQR